MNAATRQQIREAIDTRKRAAIQQARGQVFACSGCGCDRDAHTKGCRNCCDRHYNRLRRQNPVYIEQERQAQRARRRDNVMHT